MTSDKPHAGRLAVVTGASTGIGFELARLCAADGFDLIVAADEPEIGAAAEALRSHGGSVEPVQADLGGEEGVRALLDAIEDRPVDLACLNAGRGLGRAFLDQDLEEACRVIDVNVAGTTLLAHALAWRMRERGEGRILFTGSIAGLMPGAFQAVYNATKSYVNSFALALRNELKDTGVTVTCLMPGPTETEFFRRADMLDTEVGAKDKRSAADVAADGYAAAMKGSSHVISGAANKLQAAGSHLLSPDALAEQHRKMAEPGTAE